LGVWIRDPTVLPVETDDVVDEAEGDFKYAGDPPRCLPFVVEPDDPLSSQRNVATMGARARGHELPPRVDIFKSLADELP